MSHLLHLRLLRFVTMTFPVARRAGRVGTAYSLLTRDELPYLLDLHLFLSRPLRPAPVQSIADAAAAAEGTDPETSVYGAFPLVSFWNDCMKPRGMCCCYRRFLEV